MKTATLGSDLSLAILGLLTIRPASGYGLRKTFRATAMRAFSASPGAVYPALRRLREDGLIEGKVERPHALRPREVFAPTRQGRRALVGALAEPVTREDVVRRMDRLLLRFSFMTGLVGEAETLAFLTRLAEETEEYHRDLADEFRRSGPGLPFTGRAALEQGVESYRATARWARKTLGELRKRMPSKGAVR